MEAEKARAWREIDLRALDHNVRVLSQALAPGCRLMGVVKADAYGHGAVPVARRLQENGVQAFAAACLEEGISLRRAGIGGTLLILGWTPPEEAPLLSHWRLTQAVADEAHGLALAAQGVPVHVHLALDTGMHRLGIPAEDRAAIARMYTLKDLRIDGVFSHLCVSDSLSPAHEAYTQQQLQRFYRTLAWMREAGLDPGGVSSLLALIGELRDAGMAVLIATHDMDLVPLCCDEAYLLGAGKVLASGAPEELFTRPDLLRENHLRLPRIAHLMDILHDKDGLDAGPAATIGAARREILRLLKEEER